MKHPHLLLIICSFSLLACAAPSGTEAKPTPVQAPLQEESKDSLTLGAARTELYLPSLEGKRVGLLINHTSWLPLEEDTVHLLDYLLQEGVNVTTIFTPEHGFRGTADAGEKVNSGKDEKTGLPIVSLYGSNKKPTAEQLANIDVLIFDIQDVGARFYTYISSMHYAMEASAENGKKFIVLDRPNPHGHTVDGPVLDPEFRSFVGMHPIPVVHGLTVGELAKMINEEGWLAGGNKVELEVVPIENYTHTTPYTLPVKPSPNLPNQQAIMLYPSLCFFEGTPISIGRGTPFPFQVAGYPDEDFGSFTFTPESSPGAKSPKHESQLVYGIDLRNASFPQQLELRYLLDFYKTYDNKEEFFIPFFNLLAGTDELKEQIMAGATEEEIRQSWEPQLETYRKLREKYLLYPLE